MKFSHPFIQLFILLGLAIFTAAHVHPSPPPAPPKIISNCPLWSSPSPPKTYGNGKIIDISHQIRGGLPQYGSNVTSDFSYLQFWNVFWKGDNQTKPKTQNFGLIIPAHTSTHVDAPSHVIREYEKACLGVDTLDLETLIGPALLVDVPRDKNITAEVMQQLRIPRGVKRVLFRTSNTDRQLMWKPFESNYTGFTVDGAEWLVKNTDIKLIGIDYLSVAIGSRAEQVVPPHVVLLKNRDIIPVEALNLYGIPAGEYDISCLPIRLLGADGAPTRCVLIKK